MEELKMKNVYLFFCGLMAIALTACVNDEFLQEDVQNNLAGQPITVTAYAAETEGNPVTRINQSTSGEKITLSWSDNDKFSVIRNSENQTFTKEAGENIFSGTLPDEEGNGNYYAVYPANSATNYAEVPFDISGQTHTPYLMYATSENGEVYQFKHALAYIKIHFPDELKNKNATITITTKVKTNGNINLTTGAITGGNKNSIQKVVTFGSESTDVLFALPPLEADKKTLTIDVVTNEKGYTATITGEANKAIEAGKYYTATANLTETTPYLKFTAEEEQTFRLYGLLEYTPPTVIQEGVPSGLQYSLNNGTTWIDLTTTVTFGGVHGNLLLRGNLTNGTTKTVDMGGGYIMPLPVSVSFGNSNVPVACVGDIRTLINGENYQTANTGTAVFATLFSGCSQLTSAPVLPATNLASFCYYNMFTGCTNLTTAPELPAGTLAEACYSGMFNGCTNLTTAPELPAETLAESCYFAMFNGCTNLTTAPVLPAENLAKDCYYNMFTGCTNLTTAPELPAGTLAEACYSGMFNGCTNLTTAPELPAETLAENCYSGMFKNCTNLTTAPELLVETLEPYCYSQMFEGCTNLTTAPDLPAETLKNYCYYYMFKNCSNLQEPPTINAQTLATECCSEMFYNCTSLQTAPELHATTLANYCYSSMFQGCKNLVTAPTMTIEETAIGCCGSMFSGCEKLNLTTERNPIYLKDETISESCYRGMFKGCTQLTTAPALPATTVATECYGDMFYGCTSLTTAPVLPATNVSEGQPYRQMFKGCSNLSSITILATNVGIAGLTLGAWVDGVASSGTIYVPNANNPVLPTNSTSGIPSGWTVQNYQ